MAIGDQLIRFSVDDKAMADIDAQLEAVSGIERHKVMSSALRAEANVVLKRWKELIPMPGYPGDKPGLTPLRNTLAIKVLHRDNLYVIAGPRYPAGAHGHLVELGHKKFLPSPPWTAGAKAVDTGERVEGKQYGEQAERETRAVRGVAFVNAVKRRIKSILKQ